MYLAKLRINQELCFRLIKLPHKQKKETTFPCKYCNVICNRWYDEKKHCVISASLSPLSFSAINEIWNRFVIKYGLIRQGFAYNIEHSGTNAALLLLILLFYGVVKSPLCPDMVGLSAHFFKYFSNNVTIPFISSINDSLHLPSRI